VIAASAYYVVLYIRASCATPPPAHEPPRRRCVHHGRPGDTPRPWARSVSTIRAPTAGCCCVHDPTGHAGSGQRQRRLIHRSRARRPNASTSRTTTTGRPLLCARTPHARHSVPLGGCLDGQLDLAVHISGAEHSYAVDSEHDNSTWASLRRHLELSFSRSRQPRVSESFRRSRRNLDRHPVTPGPHFETKSHITTLGVTELDALRIQRLIDRLRAGSDQA
jgi:hypothetical protein